MTSLSRLRRVMSLRSSVATERHSSIFAPFAISRPSLPFRHREPVADLGRFPRPGCGRLEVGHSGRTVQSAADVRIRRHVDRLALEHPPIDLASVDYDVRDREVLWNRFGQTFSYMARVELEVQRNVLELEALLPHPPEIDRRFYAEVWLPQETHHGLILDELQTRMGWVSAEPDLSSPSLTIQVLGGLAHLDVVQDVCRMLYYLTGMSTERSAVLAYNVLYQGLADIGEAAVAETVIAPIRRQEPGHYAFYQMSALNLWGQLAEWQRWLVRRMRSVSFAPVGANNDEQRADFGDVLKALAIDQDVDGFASQIARAERDLLWANRRGLKVPLYISRAFHDAVELAQVRRLAGSSTV